MTKLKIIFMGTSEFAAAALKALIENGYEISLVITQPDREKGRGRKKLPPPVKETASAIGLTTIQPESIKTEEFYQLISSLHPDILIVTAFGHILKKSLLSLASIGAINIHGSLLPKYRGASPIQSAIINMEKETGVTTMFMDEGVDTGNIIHTAKTAILPDDTFKTLHDRLAILGGIVLIKTLKDIENNTVKSYNQNHLQATYAPIFKKEDGKIEWSRTAEQIEAFIRGMNPWPGAFTYFKGKRFKIFKAKVVSQLLNGEHEKVNAEHGTIIHKTADQLFISTGNGALSILELQADSGKKLNIKDFLSGNKNVI